MAILGAGTPEPQEAREFPEENTLAGRLAADASNLTAQLRDGRWLMADEGTRDALMDALYFLGDAHEDARDASRSLGILTYRHRP